MLAGHTLPFQPQPAHGRGQVELLLAHAGRRQRSEHSLPPREPSESSTAGWEFSLARVQKPGHPLTTLHWPSVARRQGITSQLARGSGMLVRTQHLLKQTVPSGIA